jgi:MFS family permease
MTIGVKLGNKIGARFITLIGAILINLSFILMMISTNYYLILISMCILGLGCGLSYLSVVKNCWEYYPNRLGLVYGIIITGYRLSSSILTYIAEFITIRPKKFLLDYNDFFPKEVSDKFLNYLIFLSILVFLLSVLAVCLTFNYQEKEDLSEIEGLNEKIKSENNDSSSLCKCFWSKKNLFLSLFCICAPCI